MPPDFGAPVAQNVNAPNPTAGLQTLSDLMGLQQKSIAIKQAQQNLETGAATQQTAQAQASQAQQQSNELQALGKFTANAAKDPAYLNADGTPNVSKYQADAMGVAPVYGQQYIGQMTSNFNGGVENRKALLGLNAEQRQKAASFFSNVATNPKATPEDFLDAAAQARGLSSDPAYQRMVDRILIHMPQASTLPSADASQAVNKYAQMVMSSAAGQLPTAPATVESSTNIQPGAVNRFTGAFTPSGKPIPKEPIVTTPAGPLAVARSGTHGPTLAPFTTGGASGPTPSVGPQDLNLTRAQVETQGVAGTDMASHFTRLNAGAESMPLVNSLTHTIEGLAPEAFTGPGGDKRQYLAGLGRVFGVNFTGDAQTSTNLLNKAVAQLNISTPAGTDAARALIEAGQPNSKMDADAIKTAAGTIRGQVLMNRAERNFLQPTRLLNQGAGNVQAYQENRQMFEANADPRIWQYEDLAKTNQKVADAFIAAQPDKADLVNKTRALISMGFFR